MSKVFVGNLSFDTTREQLEALFAPMGEITEIVVPTDRDSGRPRGFAFVTYANGESATQAIEKLNGVELGGRNLRVNEAMERASRPMGGGWWIRSSVRRRWWWRSSGRALSSEGQPPQHPQPQAQHLVAQAPSAGRARPDPPAGRLAPSDRDRAGGLGVVSRGSRGGVPSPNGVKLVSREYRAPWKLPIV